MKIRFVMFGKMRRPECRALFDDYARRVRHYAEMEVTELRDASPATLRRWKLGTASKPASGQTHVLLDAGGKHLNSAQFARWLGEMRDRGTREIIFLCGDAAGFPDELQNLAQSKLSLSPMTLPHELARVVLAEQIYRALSHLAGHPYSK